MNSIHSLSLLHSLTHRTECYQDRSSVTTNCKARNSNGFAQSISKSNWTRSNSHLRNCVCVMKAIKCRNHIFLFLLFIYWGTVRWNACKLINFWIIEMALMQKPLHFAPIENVISFEHRRIVGIQSWLKSRWNLLLALRLIKHCPQRYTFKLKSQHLYRKIT